MARPFCLPDVSLAKGSSPWLLTRDGSAFWGLGSRAPAVPENSPSSISRQGKGPCQTPWNTTGPGRPRVATQGRPIPVTSAAPEIVNSHLPIVCTAHLTWGRECWHCPCSYRDCVTFCTCSKSCLLSHVPQVPCAGTPHAEDTSPAKSWHNRPHHAWAQRDFD